MNQSHGIQAKLPKPGDTWRTLLLVALAIVIPAAVFGPWIPFTDLIAFCGLDSFPPELSYGPLHYYVFQFTYVLPMALSRLCMDLGIGPRGQVPFFYLFQMGVSIFVIWRLLERFAPDVPWRRLALAAGGLALWDGLFVWGGPLAYSLGAALVSLAAWLSIREADAPDKVAPWPTALLALVAAASHPFALPFAGMLFVLRLLMLRRSRWQSLLVLILLGIYKVVITRENPEPPPESLVSQLFAFDFAGIPRRIVRLFAWDADKARWLFSFEPVALIVYMRILAAIRLAGFVCAPFVAWRAKEAKGLRMLALLNTGVFLLYIFAKENELISEWPQRVLTFHASLTFVSGIACPAFLISRSRWVRDGAHLPAWFRVRRSLVFPVAEGALLALLLLAQIPVLRLGSVVEKSLQEAKAQVVRAGLHECFVEIDRQMEIKPHAVRAVPFLLFSDAEMLKSHIIFEAEWHNQPRHPSRLTERRLPMPGRPRYSVSFAKTINTPLVLRFTCLDSAAAGNGGGTAPARGDEGVPRQTP